MPSTTDRTIERLLHQPGEALRARDLRDQAAGEAQLRFWHNRMHGAYGIRAGLGVRPLRHAGRLTGVEVGPGLAYDAFGRELLVESRRRLGLPEGWLARSETLTLLLRRREAAAGPAGPAERPDAAGCFGGVVAAPDGAELVWGTGDRLAAAAGVPLARVRAQGERPLLDRHFRPPRLRPLARPRLGSGATPAGATPWEVWREPLQELRVPGFQVGIDSRAAGFTRTPCYFAWLQGAIAFGMPTPAAGGDRTLGGGSAKTARLAGLALPLLSHVAATTPAGLLVRVLVPLLSGRELEEWLLSRLRQEVAVGWLAIEPALGTRRRLAGFETELDFVR